MKQLHKALSATMAGALVLGVSNPAIAADAAVCYSAGSNVVQTGAYGTTNYPAVSNATKFTCKSTTQYTLSQLAQAGWKITQLVPVVTRITTTSEPSVTTHTKQMVLVQR